MYFDTIFLILILYVYFFFRANVIWFFSNFQADKSGKWIRCEISLMCIVLWS